MLLLEGMLMLEGKLLPCWGMFSFWGSLSMLMELRSMEGLSSCWNWEWEWEGGREGSFFHLLESSLRLSKSVSSIRRRMSIAIQKYSNEAVI